jgi:uncharacterized protein (DUF1015 family)
MARILPFRAVRPAPDMASIVASRSYETYSNNEMERLMAENPNSFLHIINPGFMQGKPVKGEARLKLAREKFEEFIGKGILEREDRPCLYLYEQNSAEGTYKGLFCATSTSDYRENLIKRHEHTLARRESMFARYLHAVRFNAEPVLMMYPDNMEVSAVLHTIGQKVPDFDFGTPEGKIHRLWIIRDQMQITRLQQLFVGIKALYIADGHHRSASSNLMAQTAREANPAHTGNEAYNYFMSCLLPESSIRIYSYPRLVRDLGGHSKHTFLAKLNVDFEIDKLGEKIWQPGEKHEFCMYLGADFYLLKLRKEFRDFGNPLDSLDSQILYIRVLKYSLGIKDPRKDKRLTYGIGAASLTEMKDQVDSGEFAVGFAMRPASVAQIRAIADAGLVMPPKSTYIEPKLRSGLTIYEF